MDYLTFIITRDEFNYVIGNYIDKVDFYTMRVISKSFYKLFINNIIKSTFFRIKNRLKYIFKDNINKFFNILEENKAIISGSFILSCILNEEYKCELNYNSDIDIYIYNKDEELDNNFSPICNFLYEDCSFKDSSATRGCYDEFTEISFVRTYTNFQYTKHCNKVTKFDVINVNKEDVKGTINKVFDFDILKNLFYISNGKLILNVNDLGNILRKIINFNSTLNLESTIQRMNKYKNRGFTVEIPNNIDNLILSSSSRLISAFEDPLKRKKMELFIFKTLETENCELLLHENCYKLISGNMILLKACKSFAQITANIFLIDNTINKNFKKVDCTDKCIYKLFQLPDKHIHYKMKYIDNYGTGILPIIVKIIR